MSFVPLCVSSCVCVPGMGMETDPSYSKQLKFHLPGELITSTLRTEGKKVWEIVRLTVPGASRSRKTNPAPAVFRVYQDAIKKTTSRKTNRLSSVTVPRGAENYRSERRGFETSGLDCIPSVKSCTLEEIDALNGGHERGVAKADNAQPADDRTVTLNVPTDSRSRTRTPHVNVKKRYVPCGTQNGDGRFLA